MVNVECLQGMDFVNKFVSDYENFEKMGLKKHEILKMLGTLDYVQDFVDTPDWLNAVSKLPKGYKWNNGTTYKQKSSKRSDSETYIFLAIGDDLYIKNLLDKVYEATKIKEEENKEFELLCASLRDKRIYIIKNWKNMNALYVCGCLEKILSPFLYDCICKFWHENNIGLDYLNVITKKIERE